MALIEYGPIREFDRGELLYILNGKPVYKDELRPVGESLMKGFPWKELWYTACLVLFLIWMGFL